MNPDAFGAQVHKVILSKGYSVHSFAKAAGLDPGGFWRLVNGSTYSCKMEIAIKILNTLDMTLEEVMQEEKAAS